LVLILLGTLIKAAYFSATEFICTGRSFGADPFNIYGNVPFAEEEFINLEFDSDSNKQDWNIS
jgi:hypothetical protein